MVMMITMITTIITMYGKKITNSPALRDYIVKLGRGFLKIWKFGGHQSFSWGH